MKRFVCILIVIGILFSLCGCSKINRLFSKNTEQSFSYPVEQMPVTLDPQIASSQAELIVIENCMEGLVRIGAGGEVIPAIAERWDISSNGREYTFYLNRSAAWAFDAEEAPEELRSFNPAITAHDFVFAVSRAVQKQTASPAFQSVSLIKNALKINKSGSSDTSSLGIRAKDDYTLVITLESANSDFLLSLADAVFMPCSETFFNYCSGRYGRQAAYFLSNAGLELRAWNETNLVLRKNESYTLPNASKADTLTLYRDENAFESFKNDNYDALAISDDNIDEALADDSLSVQTYDDTVWNLAFNLKSELCADTAFRKALVQAVDTIGLPSPEWCSAANGVVPNICTVGGEPYASLREKANFLQFAPETAAKSYESICESYFEKNNTSQMPVIRFLCTAAFDPCAKKIAQSWQQYFGTVFEVKISVLSVEQLNEAVEKGEFDCALMPVSAEATSALVFLKQFSAKNVFSFHSTSFDSLLSGSGSEKQKCVRAENYLLKQAVLYPLYTSNSYYAVRNNVKGIYFYAFGGKVNFLNAQRVD